MPIYQYQCEECLHPFESYEMGPDDKPPQWCPECSSVDIKRVPALGNFHLKGDGWDKPEKKEGE